MLKDPKISVLMAVYNGADYIRSSIESILNQTYKDFEFVIINDCSNDSTFGIINSYKDERIRLFNNERNIGQTASLNKGLKLAKGDYIARIDVDDFAFPARLERQLAYIAKHPECAVVGTSALKIYAGSRKKEVFRAATTASEALIRLFYTTPVLHVSAMMQKDAVLQVGGYDERFQICADYALWSSLIRKGYKIVSLPHVLTKFRVSEESYSRKNDEKIVSEYCHLLMENINCLTDLDISYRDAKNLFSMFKLRAGELTDEECEESQLLFKEIFSHLKEPWQLDIPVREITRPLAAAYRNRAARYLKELNTVKSRRVVYKAFREYGLQPYLLTVLIASFLGKDTLGRLVRLWSILK